MSTDNELIFNIYLVSIAGIVDACWYIILTLAVTTASKITSISKFFSIKINVHSKNSNRF